MAPSAPVYIVTGASRGLGKNTAELLLAAPTSANIVAVARTEASLSELASKYPGQVETVCGDLSDYSTGVKAVEAAIAKFGKLDGIVFNAAVIAPVATVGTVDIDEFKKLFDINYFSSLVTMKAALPHLKKTKGHVVFVSSIASHEAHYYGWEAYGASKACVDHLAATLAVEEPELFFVSIDPGVMDSDMQKEIREKHGSKMKEDHIEYLMKVKETGSILSTAGPANVISTLVVKGPLELNGQYHVFDSEVLSPYLKA
ncbi:short-chain dehydrogenase [Myxozyma melibiosi]|uniref:Short-chain dehydrogenase n=1 Tax=Myxozyma melibiosi TaxID=54550 RepID=A0ABR1FDP8_9ASCO